MAQDAEPARTSGSVAVPVPMEAVRILQARIEREGLPPEIVDLNARIAAATRNAERLCVMFGLVPCQGAINEIVALKREKDGVWLRLTLEAAP